MKNKLMKLVAIILVIFMLPLFSAFAETVSDSPASDPVQDQTTDSGEQQDPITDTDVPQNSEEEVATPEDYRDSIIGYYNANTTLTNWWDVVALYGVGANLSDYTLPEWTTESLGETATVTDYAGMIFGLIASGENVHDIWNRDIADELAKMQNPDTGLFGSYPNQQIYSILALDAAKEPYNRDLAISALINTFKTEEGAFGYLPFDPSAPQIPSADIDITALALLILDETDHADIISSSVSYLAGQQLENGGFASWGTENSNTLECVIFALSTLGLLKDERFIKNGLSLSEVLSDYILENGMLSWESGSTDENLMATQQGLIAYGDIIAGKNVFLRLSSAEVCNTLNATVRIEGSSSTVLNVPVSVKGYDLKLIDAIKKALDTNSVSYIIEDSEYGAYIKSINSETAGKFGGWDGWLAVLNGAELSGSTDNVSLSEGDEILLYYGMFAPGTLIPSYTLSATSYTQNTSFTVTVTGSYYDYTTSQDVTLPIAGATVEVGGAKFITNQNGVATVTPSLSGTQTVKIYKDNENSYPSIVRIVPFEITVAEAYTGGGGTSYIPSKPPAVNNEEDIKEESDKTKENPSTEDIHTYGDADSISDWAVDGVKKAVAAGLFKGDEAGNINPQDDLSRAELATILIRLTGSESTEPTVINFDDISPDDWFYSAVCTVYESGFMNGVGETSFAPGESVTREQAAVVLARILNISTPGPSNYTDSNEISEWAVDAVNALTETGIMEGADGKFNPGDILTREMCAVIMARALDYIGVE